MTTWVRNRFVQLTKWTRATGKHKHGNSGKTRWWLETQKIKVKLTNNKNPLKGIRETHQLQKSWTKLQKVMARWWTVAVISVQSRSTTHTVDMFRRKVQKTVVFLSFYISYASIALFHRKISEKNIYNQFAIKHFLYSSTII